jgi:Ca2+-binding RTX toxin-like protein
VTLVNAAVAPNVVKGGEGGEGETAALNGQAGQGIEPAVFNYGSGQVVVQSGKCKGKTATIVGTPGPDKLVGTGGADVFVGGAGKDLLIGGKGNDVVCGGKGKDKLFGQAGKDVVAGSCEVPKGKAG